MARTNKRRRNIAGKLSGGTTAGSIFIALVILLIYLCTSYFPSLFERTAKVELDGTLQVHFIDVGQGDSEMIVSPEGDIMLIDAGTNASESDLKQYLQTQGITEIDYAVFTHPHEDHIGGADMIMTDFIVHNVILPDVTHTSKTYEKMIESIEASDAEVFIAEAGDDYVFGSASFKVLAPNKSEYSGLNDYSVVLRMDYGGTSFLFTGDAEALSEGEMLNRFGAAQLKCDVLKVGHHGSTTSTSDSFLAAVNPDIAVILCGVDNSYGHPHTETLTKLAKTAVTVYRTDEEGSIVLSANGSEVTRIR